MKKETVRGKHLVYKADKRKITDSTDECETEIDFVGEKYRKYVRDVKVIPWEL